MEDENDEHFIFRLNDNGSGPSLLMKVCAERGWRMYQGCGDERWNLWWRTSAFPAASYKALGDWQAIHEPHSKRRIDMPEGQSVASSALHEEDIWQLPPSGTDRVHSQRSDAFVLFETLNDGALARPPPPCFHLPLEYAKLVSECSRLRRAEDGSGSNVVWIHKPVAQSQGRGIFLFRSVCEMRCGGAAVVQRYIERPLLVAGYKFDLRLYVCVPGYRPLTAYMYAEGLARFGTDKYTLSDIHNPYRHLTNSSLNKTGPRYAECKDRIGSGCKWTLKQVRRALVGRWGAVEWLVWQRVRALVTLTLLAQAAGTPPARNCFEFYGFDVLLDESMKPWLLEVNLSPALAADCEADVIVKQPMLHELFDLLGMPMRHTGLSLLQGPPTIVNSCSSEDESGAPRAPRVATSMRRGARFRRRRAMPVHCITLQHPTADKFTSSSSVGGGDSEETWRGGYATAASRRRALDASTWGNGVRWHRAPSRLGHWVRIYPHTLPQDELQLSVEEARESVAHVSKLLRAAREVVKESGRDMRAPRDKIFLRTYHCNTVMFSCSSEDESGAPRAPRVSTSTRRGARFRRRRAMPVHCITLQHPTADKFTSSSSVGGGDSEETWRGGYATAASRRRALDASTWGNGVRWHRAPSRLGHWVRIYPHTLPQDELQLSVEEARESVAHVSKLLRAAREVVKESGRDMRAPRDAARDAAFETSLRKKLGYGSHFEVWLPPF
ncbi:putative tubulin polyglutamylase TTLL2 [Papilio machaon]|uniref:Putative tubulin polyglutamylase TTLL2 n=1 Tax=Papilio machaon TaxID=76193 RepID=A0A194R0Q8_PAPMA|nr:putative tubulin polyglutamylase TTLL2 [Papilio machaon]